MSTRETLQVTVRKPGAIVAASGAVLAAGMAGLWWASAQPEEPARSVLQPACIALAIDRDSGTTTTQPCAGSPVLVAGKDGLAK